MSGRETPNQDRYFEMLAEMDVTKHLGSLEPTMQLANLYGLNQDSVLLDVGCGVGFTPCYLARTFGCRIVGIDLYESMIERSTARAKKEKLDHLLDFRIADVQDLPFEDDTFDAVMAESVIAFVPDKALALSECVRVTKPGGWVGFTESTWKQSPAPEMVAQTQQIMGENFETLDVDGWRALVEGAGLAEVVAELHDVDIRVEAKGRMQRIGCRNMMGTLVNFMRMLIRRPQYRDLYKEALGDTKDLIGGWGYGVYAGRKGNRVHREGAKNAKSKET